MTKQTGGEPLNGLTTAQAKERQEEFGKNELAPEKKKRYELVKAVKFLQKNRNPLHHN